MRAHITTIQNQYNTYTMTLQPESFTLRNTFRTTLSERLDTGNSRLPSYPATIIDGERIDFIDRNTILQLNDSQTSEQRSELMSNIIHFINNDEIRMLLINNCSEDVRNKLRDLVIRASSSETITYQELYAFGNIILYIIGNIPELATLRDVLEPLRNAIFQHDHNQIMQSVLQISPDVDRQIEEVTLRTQTELQQITDENHSRINLRILENRYTMLRVGGGLLTTMALGYAGFPYITPFVLPIISRSIPSLSSTSSIIPSSNGHFGGSIDILSWKEILQEVSKKAREFLSGCL